MKKLLLFTLMIFFSNYTFADEGKAVQEAAKIYFNALLSDSKQADKLADVPYYFDRKKVLTTREELSAIHKKFQEKAGVKLHLLSFTSSIPKEYPPLKGEEFKGLKYKVVCFTIEDGKFKGDKIMLFFKEVNGTYLAIGFCD